MSQSPTPNDHTKHGKLTQEDIDVLLKHYDKDGDNKLSDEEVDKLMLDCKTNKKTMSVEVLQVLKKYENSDCEVDDHEIHALIHEFKSTDTYARVAGYTGALARLFRYLAFTSDVGEAARPIASKMFVNATYGISIGYCCADVGWEAYKLKQRGFKTEQGHHMSMSQLIVERSTFQAFASIAVPFALIHTTVDVSKKIFNKIGRYTKFGPSLVGLAVIPVLPMYLDEPIEHGIDAFFKRFGPWAGSIKEKSH